MSAHRSLLLTPWPLRRAVEFIETHIDGDPSITDVAKKCCLSAKHFARAFRQPTGMPPHRWLIKRRIERAKQLLLADRRDLAQIALACRFADQSDLGSESNSCSSLLIILQKSYNPSLRYPCFVPQCPITCLDAELPALEWHIVWFLGRKKSDQRIATCSQLHRQTVLTECPYSIRQLSHIHYEPEDFGLVKRIVQSIVISLT
jgi:AraC-like DNA-binding protein